MGSRYKTLLKDTLIFGLGNMGTKLILFVMVRLYTSYMSDAEYGIADLVFTIAQLMAPFLSVVIFDAIIRFGLSEKERKEDIILVGVIVWVGAAVLGLALTPLVGLYKAMAEWKWYLYVYVISNIADSIGYCYLKAKGSNGADGKSERIFSCLSLNGDTRLSVGVHPIRDRDRYLPDHNRRYHQRPEKSAF